ncbi:hypothetical protein QCA50_010768 [Cerrena zonata]|uniref:Uncharacterized protein n=1 Tax=Cerrena zonata TaxID=2478898 RepID=A0AAW0FWU2_9APHY
MTSAGGMSQVLHSTGPESLTEIPGQSSSILLRTSNFLKKVSKIRSRNKQNVDIYDSTHEAAVFAARSLALGRKSFGFSQPVLGVHARSGQIPSDIEDESDASPRSSNTHRPDPALRLQSSSSQPRHSIDWPILPTQSSTGVPNPPQRSTSSPTALVNNTRHRSNSSWSRLFGDKGKSKTSDKMLPIPPQSAPPAVNGLPRTSFSSPSRSATQADGLPRCSEPSLAPSPISHSPHLSIATPRSPNKPTPSNDARNDVSQSPGRPDKYLKREIDAKQAPISNQRSTAIPVKIRASPSSADTRSYSLPSRHAVSPAIPTSPPTPTPATSVLTDESMLQPDLQRQRSLHIRLASLPPPMMARYTAEGSARLTPSVVPRPTPMPILNLPALPTPGPSDGGAREGRSRGAPLRSMPALPLTGPRDDENPEVDEEGSDSSDDGEDDEGGNDVGARDEGGSEDEDGDESQSASASRFELPRVITSPFALSFGSKAAEPPVERPPALYFTSHVRQSPVAGPSSQPLDYFSVPKQEQSDLEALRTPRPSDFTNTSTLAEVPSRPNPDLVPQILDATGPGTIPKIIPLPPTPTSPASRLPPKIIRSLTGSGAASTSLQSRPSLYHHGSKSMVDLSSHSRQEDKLPERTLEPIVAGEAMQTTSQLTSSTTSAPTLKRQRSLPMYKPASEPPPYPTFLSGHREFIIQPREEEGQEPLPSYHNTILLVGMMPRKMEFTAPGVQAKERKWRRVIVVLEGTVLRIYRTHGAGIAGKGGKVGEWWERTVGVGDWSTSDGVGGLTGSQGGIRVSAIRDRERRIQLQSQGNAPPCHSKGEEAEHSEQQQQQEGKLEPSPSKSRFHLPSSILHPGRSRDTSASGTPNASRSSLAVPLGNGSTRSRLSFDIPRERVEETLTAGRRSMDALRTPSSSRTSNLGSEASSSPTSRSPISNHSRSSSTLDPSSPSSTSRASTPAGQKSEVVYQLF